MTDLVSTFPAGQAAAVRAGTGLAARYRALVSIGAVAAMFTGITVYLFNSRAFPAPPLYWLIGLGALSVPLWFSSQTWRVVTSNPIVAWAAGYILVTALSFVWSPRGPVVVQEIRTRVLAALVIPMFLAIFSSPLAIRVARKTMLACVILAVGINCYEVVHPGAFSLVIGRSAGFYANPNIAASALILGFLLTIHVVSPPRRSLYVVFVALGVALTLSRAGLLCAALVIAYLIRAGTLRARRVALAGVAVVLIVAIAIVASGEARRLNDLLQFATRSGSLARVLDPEVAIQGADYSTNLRSEVARSAWEMFKEHPLIGGGVGATVDWSHRVSTHNIYLRLIAEFGMAGVLIYPLLLYAATRNAVGEARETATAFLLFLVPFGLFSHNVLDSWEILVGMSLMAAMATASRFADDDLEGRTAGAATWTRQG